MPRPRRKRDARFIILMISAHSVRFNNYFAFAINDKLRKTQKQTQRQQLPTPATKLPLRNLRESLRKTYEKKLGKTYDSLLSSYELASLKINTRNHHRRTGHGSFGGGKTKFARILGSHP